MKIKLSSLTEIHNAILQMASCYPNVYPNIPNSPLNTIFIYSNNINTPSYEIENFAFKHNILLDIQYGIPFTTLCFKEFVKPINAFYEKSNSITINNNIKSGN